MLRLEDANEEWLKLVYMEPVPKSGPDPEQAAREEAQRVRWREFSEQMREQKQREQSEPPSNLRHFPRKTGK